MITTILNRTDKQNLANALYKLNELKPVMAGLQRAGLLDQELAERHEHWTNTLQALHDTFGHGAEPLK